MYKFVHCAVYSVSERRFHPKIRFRIKASDVTILNIFHVWLVVMMKEIDVCAGIVSKQAIGWSSDFITNNQTLLESPKKERPALFSSSKS